MKFRVVDLWGAQLHTNIREVFDHAVLSTAPRSSTNYILPKLAEVYAQIELYDFRVTNASVIRRKNKIMFYADSTVGSIIHIREIPLILCKLCRRKYPSDSENLNHHNAECPYRCMVEVMTM